LDASERTAVVALNIDGIDSDVVCDELWENYEICTRSGAHCAPLMHKALGTSEIGAVRFSFSYFNTEHEVDRAIWAVTELAGMSL
jgi:selenocysteine lyase/cysteine desulfurase